jgi:hypothetical protein
MRKISKTRLPNLDPYEMDAGLVDTRPRRIPGATITSGPGVPNIDLDAFFARAASGPTVTGANPGMPVPANQTVNGTVSLSDGTRITFATAGQFEIVGLV